MSAEHPALRHLATTATSSLRERLKELAGQHRRHGYRMLHRPPSTRHGWAINVKRTYRVYREEGLMVQQAPAQEAACARAPAARAADSNPTRCGAWTSCSTSWPTAGSVKTH